MSNKQKGLEKPAASGRNLEGEGTYEELRRSHRLVAGTVQVQRHVVERQRRQQQEGQSIMPSTGTVACRARGLSTSDAFRRDGVHEFRGWVDRPEAGTRPLDNSPDSHIQVNACDVFSLHLPSLLLRVCHLSVRVYRAGGGEVRENMRA